MDAIEALKTRRSVRRFEAKPVSKALLEEVVDCGRLAASARNEQPWEFVVVTGPETRARLGQMATNGPFIAQAAACIVVLSKEATYYLEDGAAATQNILVAAHALGLAACWVAGDKKPYADAVLAEIGAPGGYKLVSLIAVGYGTPPRMPGKRPVADVLHWERF